MTPAHLVLVPGHAVWSGRGDPLESGTWFLKPFQNNEPALLIEHLRSGVAKAAEDPASVLVLTGGPTERQAGPRSEALAYWEIAERNGFWGHTGVREGRRLAGADHGGRLGFQIAAFHRVAPAGAAVGAAIRVAGGE
jgi:hypothetical protein